MGRELLLKPPSKDGYMNHFYSVCLDLDKQFRAGNIDCPHITQDYIDGCIETVRFLVEEGYS